MKALAQYPAVFIETQESFPKQTYRNRCYIDSPNGSLKLSIPVQHQSAATGEVQISYRENWPQKHWQALRSAYGKTPFFEVLASDLEAVMLSGESSLLELNNQLLNLILHWLQLDVRFQFTDHWQAEHTLPDYREVFRAKGLPQWKGPAYPQAFDHKYGFRPDLSILDLLFNEGPAAADYLVGR